MSYEVERILNKRINSSQGIEYFVKWKGYKHSENSWEPQKNFKDCDQMIQDFNRKFDNEKKPTLKREQSRGDRKSQTRKERSKDYSNKVEEKLSKKREPKVKLAESSVKDSKESLSRSRNKSKKICRPDSKEKEEERQGEFPFSKLNISVDIKCVQDPTLSVQNMFQDEDGMYWYSVIGINGRQTLPRHVLIQRNFMALIIFYEGHLNFKSNAE